MERRNLFNASDSDSDVDSGAVQAGQKGDISTGYVEISHYGIMQAVDALPATYMYEVFNDVPDEDIQTVIDMIDEWLVDWTGGAVQDMQGAIKDLAYKKHILMEIKHTRENNA